MFVGREQELASLEEFYAKDGIGMTVIYGRRRIGKSTLITEFVKDKKTVFYTATKIGKTRNLELFSKQVLDLFMPGIENISFNYNRTESDLATANENLLSEYKTVESIKSLYNTLQTDRADNQIWKWFVIFALLFLITEMAIIRFVK